MVAISPHDGSPNRLGLSDNTEPQETRDEDSLRPQVSATLRRIHVLSLVPVVEVSTPQSDSAFLPVALELGRSPGTTSMLIRVPASAHWGYQM